MAIFIGFGLSGLPAQTGTQAPPAPLEAGASVAALPLEDAVFDSGFARGANAADIPLTGTTDAADGAQIEARIVRADTGAQVHPWVAIATAQGGAWAGAFPVAQRSPHWLKAEVRVQNSVAPAGTMAARFAVGHVWAFYGQSNVSRFLISDTDTITPDTIAEPGNFQIWFADRSGADEPPRRRFIDNDPASEVTPGAARFANIFAQVRPGEKVAIAVHAQSGEGAISMIDPDPTRKWEWEVALHDAITAHGTQVGMVLSLSWTAFTNQNAGTMVPIMTKKLVDGTPINTGDPIPGGTLDHDMTELYDLSYTKMGFIGSSGRSIGPANETDVVSYTTVAEVLSTTNVGISRAWETVMADKVNFPEMLDFQWSHETAVMRGKPYPGGGWDDWIHFSAGYDSGFPYLGEIYANQIMRMLGMIDFDIPEITQSDWTPTHIDVWNPDHDITTRRNATGGTSPFVRGFAFDGKLMTTEAQLIANAGGSGRVGVRVTPAGGVNGSEIFTYGVGTMPGFIEFPQDYYDDYVTDLPIITSPGMVGSPGMPVKPRQLDGAFVSNLVGTPSFINIGVFTSPGLGSPFTALTIAGEIRKTGVDGGTIAAMGGNNLNIGFSSTGRMAFAANAAGFGTTEVDDVFPAGVFVPFVITFDFAAGTGKFWYGENATPVDFMGSGGGALSASRGLNMPAANHTGAADVRFVEMWKAYTPTRDTAGLGPALKRIEATAGGGAVQIPTLPNW